jgi:hypothetical protein
MEEIDTSQEKAIYNMSALTTRIIFSSLAQTLDFGQRKPRCLRYSGDRNTKTFEVLSDFNVPFRSPFRLALSLRPGNLQSLVNLETVPVAAVRKNDTIQCAVYCC